MVFEFCYKPYTPRGILAVDTHERQIVVSDGKVEYRFETAIRRALHYKQLAENLRKKYSSPKYNAWLRRRGIRDRIGTSTRRPGILLKTG